MAKFTLTIALLLAVLTAPVQAKQTRLTVMTQNLDLGTDLQPILAATDFNTLVAAVSQTFAAVVATNIPTRMDAVADEIAKQGPDLIGLQEAAIWRSQTPSDFTFPPIPTPNATTVEFDFLELLLDRLTARGLHYTPVATSLNVDAEAPGLTPGGICCRDIRLTDRDVILARTELVEDLEISNPQASNFATNLTVAFFGGTFTVLRSWASVDVSMGDTTVRFLTTHLEAVAPAIQLVQAGELLAGPANTTLPVVLVCDCNSSATGTGADVTPTYADLIHAGFIDAWSEAHPGEAGFTCCQIGTLTQPSAFTERIDLVLFRSGLSVHSAKRIGATPGDRTPRVSPPEPPARLWPSDHAGVVATLNLP
jgi:endonuclease/exonuclease/phosphatase family metal-dependent hydrolase